MQPNHNKELMGHFLIIFGFFFGAGPGAHAFMWKLVFPHMQLKTDFRVKEWAPGLASGGGPQVVRKWPIAWDWSMLLEYLKLGKTAINIM